MSLNNAVITVTVGGEQKEKFMMNLPNIRNLRGFLKGQWDLSVYDSAFPKRNRLGDVDASIELNGHTLLIEFKEAKYSMNQGQVLKAIRQAKYSNIVTLFVFGKTNTPTEYLMFTPDNLQPDIQECDTEKLLQVMLDWSRYTEANNLVSSRTEEWNLVSKYFTSEKGEA